MALKHLVGLNHVVVAVRDLDPIQKTKLMVRLQKEDDKMKTFWRFLFALTVVTIGTTRGSVMAMVQRHSAPFQLFRFDGKHFISFGEFVLGQ